MVFIVDEVDTATNNQVFIDFLAQLRAAYLERDVMPAFQSVILAGVYDIRSIKRKISEEGEYRENSPWNITAEFGVDMNFSAEEIAGMLMEYEKDCHTGMEVRQMSDLLWHYTSGYPYLVSWLCRYMDEQSLENKELQKKNAWTKEGFLLAVKRLVEDNNPLFASLKNKLDAYQELDGLISRLLFQGKKIAYNADDTAVLDAEMFGLVKIRDSAVYIANIIFETRLYHRYLSK